MRTLHNHVLTGTASVYRWVPDFSWARRRAATAVLRLFRLLPSLFSVPRRSAVAILIFQRWKRFAFAQLFEVELGRQIHFLPTIEYASMEPSYPYPISLERMVRAVEKVRIRLLRAVKALEDAALPYAVIGGNAVAAWVSRIDEAAVRNTQDVDILIRREDFDRVKAAFEQAGFTYGQTLDVHFFLDEPNGKIRDAVHLLMAGEKVKAEYATACPDVSDSERGSDFQVISLLALVEMKLNSFRRKDQTHLLDMIEVGLIDASWPAMFPAALGTRLQELLDDPNG